MHTPRPRPGSARWLRLPRRTARLRLTVLYGGAVFLACGATVLAFTYLLYSLLNGHKTYSVLFLPKQGKAVPIAAVQRAQAAIRMAGLGQLSLDRQQLLAAAGIALAVIAVAAAAIGWLIAGRVLRPLRTITAAAQRISASSLHERLALHGPDDELKELADTLDGLFARLEASFDAQRHFAANASHELRTPLTRERTLLQVTLADPAATTGTWQAISRELLASNTEQERLIEALLTLASSDVGPGRREPLDLAAITSAALAAARPAITRLGLHVHAGIQPAALDGDPLLVQQLAANLIDNAVRHNIPGGDIQIATTASPAGTVLSVANSGQIIPAADVDRLFQPFQRLGPRPARRDGGHGLGLSIVRAIATAHAATITAQPRPGGGLAIDVTFHRPPGHRPDARPAATPSRPHEASRTPHATLLLSTLDSITLGRTFLSPRVGDPKTTQRLGPEGLSAKFKEEHRFRRFRVPAQACWRGLSRRVAGGGQQPRAWERTGTGVS
jgi:signal transduction histidine kinase